MALTDIFISPSGAGDNSGSSVANALPAISSGDWSTNIEGLDRANKRFVFLAGTYNCTTKLTFSGSAPTATQPNQWVGADSSGNILRPKFQESCLLLDLTDYPLFVCSANTAMIDTEENTYYKCLSFENTSTSYSQTSVVETSTADVDQQHWVGCNFKCKARNTAAHCATVTTAAYHSCVFHIEDPSQSTFDAVVKATNNATLDNCRIIGPVGPDDVVLSSGGDQGGLYITALTSKVRNCVITNVLGIGVKLDATSTKAEIDVANCTICGVNSDGINCTGAASNLPGKGSLQGNIIFDCTGNGIEANSDDSRQSGAQILAMGSNDAGNFSNMDSYEDMIDVIAITTADFVDYANKDYRIKRTSPLYNFYGDRNFGAIQNEDYEFVSVS
tara:strand:- start:21262 stop:22425 length:1164 start_codon:yes stop_codon:yes gene_type:complete